ncbi:hypothetical protein UFOVP196_42 [uncultured Caudovirales phage]|uniref:Uncharacterized protein n=1 Tax=uncultured Caudovirales phage TaxID=2100421 RepID=A0A6J7WFD1_9CAUD|nr:hypothetical protein UFOVP196_42 [uncultured Caudovirales phage]
MKRAVYHRRDRANVKQALQATGLVLAFLILPKPVEIIAQSDLLGPMIALIAVCAAAAFAIWSWPVKR